MAVKILLLGKNPKTYMYKTLKEGHFFAGH